jgi:hypothetical protein
VPGSAVRSFGTEEKGMVPIVLCLSVLAVVVALCILLAKRRREAFHRRFPPISDAEFLARCAPGTNPRVALKVRRIVAESLGIEPERVYPSSRLIQDLGAA